MTQFPKNLKKLFYGVLILGSVVLGVFLFWYIFGFLNAPPEIRFSLVEHGTPRWYALQGNKITKAKGPVTPDAFVSFVQETAAPLKSTDVPVLIRVGTNGSFLGVIKDKTSVVRFLTSDSAFKAGLTDRPDGRVAFSEYSEATTTYGVTEGKWTLIAFSLYEDPAQKPAVLGAGFSPRFVADGSLVAIAPEGLVRIDPVDGGRSTLIERTNMSYGLAAISPDALLAILPNSITGTLDVFSVNPKNANGVSFVGSITSTPQAVGFLSTDTFVVKEDARTFSLYSISAGKIRKVKTVTL